MKLELKRVETKESLEVVDNSFHVDSKGVYYFSKNITRDFDGKDCTIGYRPSDKDTIILKIKD